MSAQDKATAVTAQAVAATGPPSEGAERAGQSGMPPRLATPVQYVKGVGPQRAPLLERLGLSTVTDLLYYLPRDYQDLTDVRKIADLQEGPLQSVRGRVVDLDFRELGIARSVVGVLVHDGQSHLRAVWFNQPYMVERFRVGQYVLLSARPRFRGGRWEMNSPRVQWLNEEEEVEADQPFVPVYGLTEGLPAPAMQRIVQHALEAFADEVPELFPEDFRRQHGLMPIASALRSVHFPQSREEIQAARRRIVYEEFFLLQLALALRKGVWKEHRKAPVLEATAKIDARIRRLFRFALTPGQGKSAPGRRRWRSMPCSWRWRTAIRPC
ncbi:MAG: hypothetical protein HY000_05380 [Planctomycetes bacterium]|nr:hypothetical protein [Planctomycetota bacterium]